MSGNKEPQKLDSFEKVWAHYLKEHSHPKTRRVHALTTVFGTVATVGAAVAAGVVAGPVAAGLTVVFGAAASIGMLVRSHTKYQGNKPVFAKHSKRYAVMSDLRMTKMWWQDKIRGTNTVMDEYKRLGIDGTGKGTKAGPDNSPN